MYRIILCCVRLHCKWPLGPYALHNVKHLHRFISLRMLTGLHQKISTHESPGQGEDYATIAAPDTRAYAQLEMTPTR